MTVWSLDRLRFTVRKITGKFDSNQIPDASDPNLAISLQNPPGIDDYINDFYLYDFPEHMRTLKLKDWFSFTTIPNCGTYNVPLNIYDLEPPLYIDNYQYAYYQSPDQFYRLWPDLDFVQQNLYTPDGINKTYSFQLSSFPVQQGTVVLGLQPNLDGNPSPQYETFTDQDTPVLLDQPALIKFVNPGTLTGNLGGTGTIDYLTGLGSVTYDTPPPVGALSSIHYHPYVASRTRDVLFFQQQLFLRPIPNDTYTVKMLAYVQPTVALGTLTNSPTQPQFNDTLPTDQVPLFQEWWQCIAYGAALKILAEEGDHEEYARNQMYFEQQKLLAQRKCLKQLATQRIQTRYGEMAGLGPTWPIYPIY